ncbi:ABC transporter permease [Fontibacillus sp. BL9]|uniref:ABC transporter permease n=1 Tax=Fontibacillus sp. BL9 TaxID=3389971 RepID=UPI00397911F5
MNPIFLAQWMKDKRSPLLILSFCGLSILATLLFGFGIDSQMKISVFKAPGMETRKAEAWLNLLNKGETIKFVIQDEDQARSEVREGRTDAAVQLMENDYRIIAAIDNPNVQLVEHHVHSVFVEELRLRAAEKFADDAGAFRKEMAQYQEAPPLALNLRTSDGDELIKYDMSLQLLFTFSLFLAMFTVGYKINSISQEKVSGIWSRVILSPVSKFEMYTGHLMYSSLIGFLQISAVFVLFNFAFGLELGGRFGMLILIAAIYTLSIVAMSMLLTGILKTPEQFNIVFPSAIPVMPLLSGAYMPPGTITNKFLLGISEIFPLKHAMDALVAVAIYNGGWQDIFLSIAKLCIIGVICMGVGINLMERRRR